MCHFFGLSQCFQHSRTSDKLSIYGIRGVALDWYKSYLSDRKLSVKCHTGDPVKQVVSDEHPVEYSVAQGNCLGPLLFLVFCNDLPLNLLECKGILFADDTTIYKMPSNINYLMWCVSEELK